MDDVQSLIEELRFGAENGADAELLERAADKIQELVADLGDADAAMTEYWMKKNKWIRCEDRLPLYGQDVLAARMYGADADGWAYEIVIAHICNIRDSVYWNATNITHWMPLPDAPEVEA